MEQRTRASLLSRVRDCADDLAWSEFDVTYRELIVRYARRRGLQVSDAEDVRQAVMMRLAERLRSFRYDSGQGRFRDYLRRCVRNEVARLYGRRSGSDAVPIDELAAGAEDVDDLWEAEWRAHHLRLAMAKARAAFEESSIATFERLLAGESPEAIATGQATTVDAVYKVRTRLRSFLRERIAEQLSEEEDGDGRS
ncbi:RNA polymerase sigma factor [Engelhardtia mirabilis]